MIRLTLSLAISLTPAYAASPSEWLTWGYDQERTGWNQAETTLAPGNVAQLELKWKAQLPTSIQRSGSLHPHGSSGRHSEHTAGTQIAGVRRRQ